MDGNDLVGTSSWYCPSVGLRLRTWAMDKGLATTSTLLSYPDAIEEAPYTDRPDPLFFSSPAFW